MPCLTAALSPTPSPLGLSSNHAKPFTNSKQAVNSFKADAAQRSLFVAGKFHFKSQNLDVTWHFCKIRPCDVVLAPVTTGPSLLQLLFWSSVLYLPLWYITMATNIEKKNIHKQVVLVLNIIFLVFTFPALHVGGILYLHLPLDGIASAGTFPAAPHPCRDADPQKSRGLGAPAPQSTLSAQAPFSAWISKRAPYAKWAPTTGCIFMLLLVFYGHAARQFTGTG